MHDGLDFTFTKQAQNSAAVTDVDLGDGRRLTRRGRMATRQIVQNDDRVTSLYEPVDGHTANVPRTSGDGDSHISSIRNNSPGHIVKSSEHPAATCDRHFSRRSSEGIQRCSK